MRLNDSVILRVFEGNTPTRPDVMGRCLVAEVCEQVCPVRAREQGNRGKNILLIHEHVICKANFL